MRISNKSLFRILSATLALIFALTLVSCNDQNPSGDNSQDGSHGGSQVDAEYGNKIGDICFAADLETFDGEAFNLSDTRGKVTVVNFWGEWCPWCLYELPDFDRVASEYESDIEIIAIQSVSGLDDGLKYAEENFPDTEMTFVKDANRGGLNYYQVLGGDGSYPRTLILDRDGVIVFEQYGTMSYDKLVEEIKKII